MLPIRRLALFLSLFASALIASPRLLAQRTPVPTFPENLISSPGPMFTVAERDLPQNPLLIVYGDMRFTSPADTVDANPVARRLLAAKIAAEHPDAVLVSGDVPFRGANPKDYDQFRQETAAWRTEHLRVYPALGNHETAGATAASGDPLNNWWATFPELRNRRWYSVQFGQKLYFLMLDSTSALTEGSRQMAWLQDQIAHVPHSVEFVFIDLHHPPVADMQTRYHVDHNPRPNEIALRDYLSQIAPQSPAKFIVAAGHTHNYMRLEKDGVTYLVSGGGGAQPYLIDRTPDDKYQGTDPINFHYITFRLDGKKLRGAMIRLDDQSLPNALWQTKDTFVIAAR